MRTKDLPIGFMHLPGWASHVSAAAVRDAITWEQRTIQMFGHATPVPRLTAWMGTEPYTYSGIRHEPTPMPAIVEELAGLARTAFETRFNSVLGNLYRDGSDSVSWHSDDEPELGAEPVIASLSLGGRRRFSVRAKSGDERPHHVDLNHGDVILMTGRSQLDYQHCVTKTTRPVRERINLTFRLVMS